MKNFTFEIGCDPELIFFHHGNPVEAENVFRFDGLEAHFGYDGDHTIAEIRPGPASAPFDLVTKIHKCMSSSRVAHKFEWFAGAFKADLAIGGHIHFSRTWSTSPWFHTLLKYLNAGFASIRNAWEPVDEISARRGRGYGVFNTLCYRDQPWGWEYRPLLSWLITPAVALFYISYAKALTHIFFEGAKKVIGEPPEISQIFTTSFARSLPDPRLKNIKKIIAFAPADCKEGLAFYRKFLLEGINWKKEVKKEWKI